MVSAGWWPGAPQQQRQHAIAGRMLALPDGTWWLFGAWARWYRWHPSDRQWYLCPPPQAVVTRKSARPPRSDMPLPGLPPHVVPAGPDFEYAGPAPLPFVGESLSPELSSHVLATVEAAAALPAEDYPHWWALFPSSMPSTVAATWGVMLWCAAAPVFDSRLDEQLLGLWAPYRARPLPQLDGPRWLTPPPLEALLGLYAERLRSGRVDAAVVVLRTLWATASALRGDPRFQARADALLAILGATLNNPTMDYGALRYGDQALVQQWLTRCPPQLAPAVRIESSPGDNFRHAYYELAQAVTAVCGDPADPAYLEPRLIAAALIAADLAVVRQDVAVMVIPWLDPEIRYTVQAALSQSGHPLRRLWPKDNRLPEVLRGGPAAGGKGVTRDASRNRDILLATMFAADLAWCRLGGGIPARPRGFPVPTAAIAEIIGVDRAKAAASAQPITLPPGISPMSQQDSHGKGGGDAPVRQESADPAPPAGADEPPPPEQPPVPGPPPAGETTPDVPEPPVAAATKPAAAGPLGTRIITEEIGSGHGQATPTDRRPTSPPRPGTRVMSKTMVGDMMDAPMPEQPLDEIDPPPQAPALPVVDRFGISFVCGVADENPAAIGPGKGDAGAETDAGRLLDELTALMIRKPTGQPADYGPTAQPTEQPADYDQTAVDEPGTSAVDAAEVTAVDVPGALDSDPLGATGGNPGVLLVGAPHTGQRRLTRMIALALADAGMGDGSVRTAHANDGRGAAAEQVTIAIDRDGPAADDEADGGSAVLFEHLDATIMAAFDPAAAVEAVLQMRRDTASMAFIATCEPHPYRRLVADHPDLVATFRIFRLPDLTGPDARLTLLHVLADERRVTVDSAGLEVVRTDLDRLRGPGELVNARLVETYLERACHRRAGWAGASWDRLILTPGDFAGVAAEIEPALREPAAIDGFLRELEELIGLDTVKETIKALVEEARADRRDTAVRHLIFFGPPGVGKATVAGLLGGMYATLGVLDSGHLVACRPAHLAGRDAADTEIRVSAMAEQAMGGVLLIEEAEQLVPSVAGELLKHMVERRGDFMIVCCTGAPGRMTDLLAANPDFQAEFAHPVEFAPFTDRQLGKIFQKFAEDNLYRLDEELRVELLARFARLREEPGFAYAITARRLFDETVSRQANRLAGSEGGAARPSGRAEITAATVARLTARDLPETALERMMGHFLQDPGSR